MFYAVQLSKSDPTPLYIQLASQIAKLIQSKTLSGGTKLPPIRSLSKSLSINRDTVVSAYKLLETQGLVEAHIGKGTYVLEDSSLLDTPIYCSSLGFSRDLFPLSLCSDLAQHIIRKEGWDAFSDPFHKERIHLTQNICYFLKDLGISASLTQVRIIKNYNHLLLSLVKYSSKKGICIEQFSDLTHPSYLRSIGSKLYEVPLTPEGLDLKVLEKYLRSGNIGYIFLSSYLQNPTGICYSNEQKQKLIYLANKYDCYIIEDGTLSDFLYPTTPVPLFYNFSTDRVIYVYHFSKVYLPYLPYSFILLPNPMLKSISDDLSIAFNEYFLRYYLESDLLKNYKKITLTSYKKKYNRLLEGLSDLKPKIKIYANHGGIFFWLKPLTRSLDEICTLFIQNHIIVAPGNLFSYTQECDYFRLSITQIQDEHIDKILDLLHTHL